MRPYNACWSGRIPLMRLFPFSGLTGQSFKPSFHLRTDRTLDGDLDVNGWFIINILHEYLKPEGYANPSGYIAPGSANSE